MNAHYDYIYSPRLAVDGTGNVHVAWFDKRSDTPSCFYDVSSDAGETFSTDTLINPQTRSLPKLAVGSDNQIYVTWIDLRNGNENFDVFFAEKK